MMVARILPDLPEIHVLPCLGLGEVVIYAVVEAGQGAREFLAARLLEALGGSAPEWAGALEGGNLVLDASLLGQPRLKLGGKPGPGLSFSEAGGLLWGAMTRRGQVGVDAAREKDFASSYPYSRAFGPEEWDWAWRHCQGRTAAAAALLWAAKEAAVKARGIGFHVTDPRDLEVAYLAPAWEGLNLVIQGQESVSIWARPLADGWLALAVV